ncbi:globin [Novimethylophilus kurashikiensis]|uniref:Globin n=1 Tax=Novimethylophilus kurashikiensis TaxID=1825523 RepID=A0A2R5FBH4_9PROT|nr:DUF4326 domain-containing protein [Novimethylophilus kurashikiensis]GBG14253.1 globin [Novimethylophilus kurashikiensis]
MADKMFYAGIGSRETPAHVMRLMVSLARVLAGFGYVLRSGAADGADSAFEAGCEAAQGESEIWLPWRGFNNHADTGFYPSAEHESIAATAHPAWEKLSRGPRALHSRNVGQVLGADCKTPVKFVLCWTADGCEHESTRTSSTGGTATAIVIASRMALPVVNLANPKALELLEEFLGLDLRVAITELTDADALRAELACSPGINIYSGEKGLGGALTNMSERARDKGCIRHSYPVTINGLTYPDSEAAYQALKRPGDAQYNDGLMVDIICLKFLQNPKLQALVTQRGGVSWLARCSHITGAKSPGFQSWEGQGINSRFIRNLIHGYQKSLTNEGPETRVVHVKEAPYDVYIGRANGSLEESIWANPWVIGKDGTRDDVLRKYYQHASTNRKLMSKIHELRFKTLACWCNSRAEPDTQCHGHILAALADGRPWSLPEPAQKSLF